ncbi:phenylacetic acid degradation bifunctional protein PaaZ [Flavipsychrobacter stenotrophus]|uniref:Phenylacetic acid degradation bifunctional protein PaaZ n=1 Tax=Flavipsychrobacter stenotrophus TaxID=2077091 RepID=A0A2S7T0W0_9BACT|nr:phenylacetic acid degradation bifunctional protein PaaZ [Flavipsychrobacter stenotrophus]PQJ12497.1 phenylacetic acid degradation bifunctional protein PaaZ [Flavipsychrobacter stenotrophus]
MSVTQLKNYAEGKWVSGKQEGEVLHNAVTGAAIYSASSDGLDFGSMMDYARKVGGKALRKLTFQQRGLMLKALALYLQERKEYFYTISAMTGATRSDSWVDIEGGIGNLFTYASLRRQFPDERFYVDGEAAKMSKGNTFMGHHIMVPKEGVAIHINAFNFPVWGMLEKIAVNLLAGVPAIVKPASLTSYLTEAVFEEIIKSNILPEGSLQLICGSARGILDSIQTEDTVTFTGSASTGRMLKSHPRIVSEAVSFTMEADSLNCCILGTDVYPGSAEFDIFIKEVVREITTKAGQKCTAIRRIIVPADRVEDVQIALGKRLASNTIGDPSLKEVRMGPLAGITQRNEVRERVALLSKSQSIVIGNLENFEVMGADKEKGAFLAPIIFFNDDPFVKTDCHDIEAFGPVSTIMPYNTIDDAIELSRMGKGSLVSSIVTADDNIAKEIVLGTATMHGRILILNADCAKESTGHGSPMPMLVHGGPGRAGGGEEMGGKRGVMHYLHRTAIQGSPTTISAITNVYQQYGKQHEYDKHPFKKHFEELEISETLVTAKHTVSEADITNFANVSGDNFYAHMDATSLEGTIFEGRVAHGYFILSKAAGLFVDAKKGPVLLNYGIDECRFTKPVYPGMTIGVKLTVKEKIAQEKRTPEDIAKGIVKWLVEVYDQTNETVAIATILTMVKMKEQG